MTKEFNERKLDARFAFALEREAKIAEINRCKGMLSHCFLSQTSNCTQIDYTPNMNDVCQCDTIKSTNRCDERRTISIRHFDTIWMCIDERDLLHVCFDCCMVCLPARLQMSHHRTTISHLLLFFHHLTINQSNRSIRMPIDMHPCVHPMNSAH